VAVAGVNNNLSTGLPSELAAQPRRLIEAVHEENKHEDDDKEGDEESDEEGEEEGDEEDEDEVDNDEDEEDDDEEEDEKENEDGEVEKVDSIYHGIQSNHIGPQGESVHHGVLPANHGGDMAAKRLQHLVRGLTSNLLRSDTIRTDQDIQEGIPGIVRVRALS